MIFLISAPFWMKGTILILALKRGHSRGLTSKTRFIKAAQEAWALVPGSGIFSGFAGERFFRSPLERQE